MLPAPAHQTSSPGPARAWPLALALGLGLALSACPAPAPPGPAPARTGPRPRLVVLSPAVGELICALGASEHVVGVSSFSTAQALAKVPRLGGVVDPALDRLDALAPDRVLVQGHHQALTELAERRPYELQTVRIEGVADLLATLEDLGALLGREERAAREVARLRAALAPASELARGPRVLVVFGHQAGALGQVSPLGEGSFVSECLAAAGGQNCLTGAGLGRYPQVSLEYVLELAPDIIVELAAEPVSAEQAAALRADWASLSSVPAVREGRVAVVWGDEVLIPGPRLDRLVEKLRRALAGEPLVPASSGAPDRAPPAADPIERPR